MVYLNQTYGASRGQELKVDTKTETGSVVQFQNGGRFKYDIAYHPKLCCSKTKYKFGIVQTSKPSLYKQT